MKRDCYDLKKQIVSPNNYYNRNNKQYNKWNQHPKTRTLIVKPNIIVDSCSNRNWISTVDLLTNIQPFRESGPELAGNKYGRETQFIGTARFLDRVSGRVFEEEMQYNEDNKEIVLSAKKLVENNWHVTLGSNNTLQKEDVTINGRMINGIVQLTSVEVIHPDNYSSHPINLKVDVKRNEKKL